jgi:hypothetical protein
MNFETMLRVWRAAAERCIECTLRLDFETMLRVWRVAAERCIECTLWL